MKNWQVALSTIMVRAIAMVPRALEPASFASFLMGSWVAFWFMSGVNPPPWIMNPGITRWKIVLS